jgi:hypothetical protein
MAKRAGPIPHQFLIGLGLLGAIALLTAMRAAPTPPRPESAPADQFSAARAAKVLGTILGDQAPHPLGTPEAAAVRDRVVEQLRSLRLIPIEQVAPSCRDEEEATIPCPTVHNLMARIEGHSAGRAVLLMVHSDSTPKGPGAADDGSGVAIALEAARAILAGEQPNNPIVILITDGEEKGLLGARAFVRREAWLSDIGAVVNLEARGTSGPSRMFETSGPNGWLVDLLAKSLPRPVTSSLFPSVYERLPNDTDFTILKRHGIPGMNFAFIGSAQHYHTTQDDLAHLSLESLQHQGENALAIVRALASTDLNQIRTEHVVFFDLFARWIVRWPEPWTLPLAVASLLLILTATIVRWRQHRFTFAQWSWSISVFLMALVGSLVVGLLAVMAIRKLGFAPKPWVDAPVAFIAPFWLIGLLSAWGAPRLLGRRCRAEPLWLGVWFVWSVLALIAAKALPGGSYLFVVPSLVAGVTAVTARPGGVPSVFIPFLSAAVIWSPLILAWYEALGIPVLFCLSLFVALVVSTLAPLLVSDR